MFHRRALQLVVAQVAKDRNKGKERFDTCNLRDRFPREERSTQNPRLPKLLPFLVMQYKANQSVNQDQSTLRVHVQKQPTFWVTQLIRSVDRECAKLNQRFAQSGAALNGNDPRYDAHGCLARFAAEGGANAATHSTRVCAETKPAI